MTQAVLYLTNTRHGQQAWQNPSARHRCYHFADGLVAAGLHSSVMHVDEMRAQYARKFQHIIFHRPVFDRRFRKALDKCRNGTAVLHADYDDLLFEPELASVSPKFLNGNSSVKLVAKEFANNLQAMRCFDNFITSTRFLAGRIRDIKPDAAICVLPNATPRQFIVPRKLPQLDNHFTIGYFPGSNSHGHDFESVREVLGSVLSKYKHSRLLIAGQFRSEDCAGLPRVMQVPFADYNRYLFLLRQVDLSIAPLVDNLFNQAKSAVKLIESVSVGTRIIVSPNGDMLDHDNDLVEYCSNTDEWHDQLDCSLRQSLESWSDKPLAVKDSNDSGAHSNAVFSVQNRLPVLLEHLQCAA